MADAGTQRGLEVAVRHDLRRGPGASRSAAFLRNLARGEAYLSEAPTLWDITFQTAVAQAELEARDYPGHYYRVAFHRSDASAMEPATPSTSRPPGRN